MDVDIHQRDLVQQVAAGLLGFPVSHRPDVLAYAILLRGGLPLRAGVQGGQESQHDKGRLCSPRPAHWWATTP